MNNLRKGEEPMSLKRSLKSAWKTISNNGGVIGGTIMIVSSLAELLTKVPELDLAGTVTP
jgi:hypothetical protein